MQIQPQYLTLSKLLNGRLFRIPEYQRAYSWTKRERRDLFDDIERMRQDGNEDGHFMATVVLLRRGKQHLGTDEFFELDVVDGQQRLTTLLLLLKCISTNAYEDSEEETKLAREIDNLLVKEEADEILLLQTNHDSSQFFARFLRHGTASTPASATTLADRELLAAIEDCQQFVNHWRDAGNTLTDLGAIIKNQLFFILHEIDDEKLVYTVFEVLNSRGLDVSWFDRLKSIMMGQAFGLKKVNQTRIINELHSTWREIYRCIGLRQGFSTEALRFAATLFASKMPSKPLGEEDAVTELRSGLKNATAIRKVSDWLLRVTRACDEIAAQRRINAVTRIAQARLVAASLYLRDDLTCVERDDVLTTWENVTFRIYGMLCNDARTQVGNYVRLAWCIVNEKLSCEDIKDELKKIGREYPISEAIEDIRESDCYNNWEEELRYMLYRYEEHLAQRAGQTFSNEQWERIWSESPSKSIEHIQPQSSPSKRGKHWCGNLLLLPPGLNSKLKDAKPSKKAESYTATGLFIAAEVAGLIKNNPRWPLRAIKEREKRILTWAKKEWAD